VGSGYAKGNDNMKRGTDLIPEGNSLKEED
jgi:hypothetical protein